MIREVVDAVSLEQILRLFDKISVLIGNKSRGPSVGYLALRLLCTYAEAHWGCHMLPDEELAMRELAREMVDSEHAERFGVCK